MWDEVFKMALSNGIWAVLFLGLLIFQLKDSHKREAKYQDTISHLNKSLGIVSSIKEDVDEMKKDVKEISKRVKPKLVSQKKNKVEKGQEKTVVEVYNEATNF